MTIETGLSDFHKMTVTVLKQHFKKKEPVTIKYHDLNAFDAINFRREVKQEIEILAFAIKQHRYLVFPTNKTPKFFIVC